MDKATSFKVQGERIKGQGKRRKDKGGSFSLTDDLIIGAHSPEELHQAVWKEQPRDVPPQDDNDRHSDIWA